jgi:hypothetical protein
MDNIKMDLGEIGSWGVGWIGLIQDKDKWRALVDVAMNLKFHKILGGSRVVPQPVASRIVFGSIVSFNLVSYGLSSSKNIIKMALAWTVPVNKQ